MNNKGSAVVAVIFPNGMVGKVIICEYPQCITMFCRLLPPRMGIVPPPPEIDVEVCYTINSKAIVRGVGCDLYPEQIRTALMGYLTAKKFV